MEDIFCDCPHEWVYSHYFSEAGNQYYFCVRCGSFKGFYTGSASRFPVTMKGISPGKIMVTNASPWQSVYLQPPPVVEVVSEEHEESQKGMFTICFKCEDGSLLVEWISGNARFEISLGKDVRYESKWYYVTKSGDVESGHLSESIVNQITQHIVSSLEQK